MLTDDLDVKIAGDKPSEDVRRNNNTAVQNSSVSSEQIKAAKAIGKAVANSFIRDAETEVDEEFRDFDMIVQRRLLLSFTATAGFEKYIGNDTLDGIAQKSFLRDDICIGFYICGSRHGGDQFTDQLV